MQRIRCAHKCGIADEGNINLHYDHKKCLEPGMGTHVKYDCCVRVKKSSGDFNNREHVQYVA